MNIEELLDIDIDVDNSDYTPPGHTSIDLRRGPAWNEVHDSGRFDNSRHVYSADLATLGILARLATKAADHLADSPPDCANDRCPHCRVTTYYLLELGDTGPFVTITVPDSAGAEWLALVDQWVATAIETERCTTYAELFHDEAAEPSQSRSASCHEDERAHE